MDAIQRFSNILSNNESPLVSKINCSERDQEYIRGAHGSRFWSIFDSFFVCFCRHRSSKMKSKMNWKMRSVNPTPLKFSKMRSKMSEKWNNMFFGTVTALNSTARCRLHFILSLSEYYLSASNLPQVFTNYSLVY